MADGHYEAESGIDRRIVATVQAASRALRAEIEIVRKQAAAADLQIAALKEETELLKARVAELETTR